MSIQDQYQEHLHALLELQPLSLEAGDAPALRLLAMPSFDPELALTLVGGDAPRLTVATLSGSAWYHLSAQEEAARHTPVLRLDAPARLITTTHAPAQEVLALLATAAAALPLDRPDPTQSSLGVDGMPVSLVRAEGGYEVLAERWSPRRSGDAVERLVIAAFGLASAATTDPVLQAALTRAGRYWR